MATDLKPEDPCRCNSGRPYGSCHQPIVEAPKGRMIEFAREIYASEWAANAEAYDQQGIYDNLAAELAARGQICRLLDVGCGLGHGLKAMRAALEAPLLQLIGLDENPSCLISAAKRLGVDIRPDNTNRLVDVVLPNGLYRSMPRPGPLTADPGITLIQCDLLVRDETFSSWLESIGPLDAITLWFSGVHKARSATELASFFEIRNDADHRECVEDAVFQLARQHLRPSGVLQVVNRGGFPSESLAISEHRRIFGTVAEDAGLALISIIPHRYDEPVVSNSVRVRSLNRDVDALPHYAVSMLFEPAA